MKRMTTLKIKRFIDGDLKEYLINDLANLHIVKESDLQACAYAHLRRFIGWHNEKWRILVNKYASPTRSGTKPRGYHIDLLVFEKNTPRIALEFKYGQSILAKNSKDHLSLKAGLKYLGVAEAYWISAMRPKTKPKKQPSLEENIRLIVIRLPDNMLGTMYETHEDWEMARRAFR